MHYQFLVSNYQKLAKMETLHKIVMVLLANLVLIASAKIQIPFWPVPATLQTLAIAGIGFMYGSRAGAAVVALYLLEGLVGLPVFAGPLSGTHYLLGSPTAGFLLSFVPAAYFAGLFVEKGLGKTIPSAFVASFIPAMMINLGGLVWLTHLIGMNAALSNSVLWMPGTFTKIGIATLGLYLVKKK
jgi:biotin transport system substrate-specific component